MKQVRRANVILTIKDDQVDRFIQKGYDLLDDVGNVVRSHETNDPEELQKRLKEAEQVIQKLELEIKQLKEKKAEPVSKKSAPKKKS